MRASAKANPNVPRRSILWFASIVLGLFTCLMALFFEQSGWNNFKLGFVAVCAAMTFGLVVTLVNATRFWWGMRLVTLVIFALSFWAVVDEGFIHRHPTHIGSPGEPSLFNAIRGFLFFGLPSLLYTLWGSTWGKLGGSDPRNIGGSDILVLRLAIVGRWLFLALTLLTVASLTYQASHTFSAVSAP